MKDIRASEFVGKSGWRRMGNEAGGFGPARYNHVQNGLIENASARSRNAGTKQGASDEPKGKEGKMRRYGNSDCRVHKMSGNVKLGWR